MKLISSLLVSDMYILFNAINPRKMMSDGVVGAVLIDLVIQKKIEIIGTKINLIDTTSTGNSYLDRTLSIVDIADIRNLSIPKLRKLLILQIFGNFLFFFGFWDYEVNRSILLCNNNKIKWDMDIFLIQNY
ncbi:MAG: hypothetical protein ACFFDG_14400 [Promethearchaeota archaeon]